jgi:hypothetical protein
LSHQGHIHCWLCGLVKGGLPYILIDCCLTLSEK